LKQEAKNSLSSIDKTINMQLKGINESNMEIVMQNEKAEGDLLTSPISGVQANQSDPIANLNVFE
jgi:hypothetical protein